MLILKPGKHTSDIILYIKYFSHGGIMISSKEKIISKGGLHLNHCLSHIYGQPQMPTKADLNDFVVVAKSTSLIIVIMDYDMTDREH